MPKFINAFPPRKNRIFRILFCFLSMVIIAFSVYLEIVSDVGLSPWDALNEGLSKTLPITFGTASISIGVIVIAVDLIMKEKIGFGTLMDTFCIGSIVDVFNAVDPVPHFQSIIIRVILFILALVILSFGIYLYMSVGLSCGPRDTLMVAIGKKFRKLTNGTITTIMYVCVLSMAWVLGATLGVGTILSLTCNGIIMDLVFQIVRFEPRDVIHEDFIKTIETILTNK